MGECVLHVCLCVTLGVSVLNWWAEIDSDFTIWKSSLALCTKNCWPMIQLFNSVRNEKKREREMEGGEREREDEGGMEMRRCVKSACHEKKNQCVHPSVLEIRAHLHICINTHADRQTHTHSHSLLAILLVYMTYVVSLRVRQSPTCMV